MVGRKIIWTKRANKNFDKTLEYLENEFGSNVTKAFVLKTFKTLDILSEFPKIGTIEDKIKGVRGFVLSRHHTLFYRFTDDEIIILNLFSNKQNPKKEKY